MMMGEGLWSGAAGRVFFALTRQEFAQQVDAVTQAHQSQKTGRNFGYLEAVDYVNRHEYCDQNGEKQHLQSGYIDLAIRGDQVSPARLRDRLSRRNRLCLVCRAAWRELRTEGRETADAEKGEGAFGERNEISGEHHDVCRRRADHEHPEDDLELRQAGPATSGLDPLQQEIVA